LGRNIQWHGYLVNRSGFGVNPPEVLSLVPSAGQNPRMKSFLREVNEMDEPWRKLERLKKATDEELYEFLIELDDPEFHKLKVYRDRVKEILDERKHRQAKEAKVEDHRIGARTLHWTVWVALLTAAGILIGILLSLLLRH